MTPPPWTSTTCRTFFPQHASSSLYLAFQQSTIDITQPVPYSYLALSTGSSAILAYYKRNRVPCQFSNGSKIVKSTTQNISQARDGLFRSTKNAWAKCFKRSNATHPLQLPARSPQSYTCVKAIPEVKPSIPVCLKSSRSKSSSIGGPDPQKNCCEAVHEKDCKK